MDSLADWINKKLEEGFSSDDIKKALKEEGFDPTLVDVVLQKRKSELSTLKKKLVFLTLVLSSLIVLLLFFMFSLENEQKINNKNLTYFDKNTSLYQSFFEKGYFVTTDKIPFKLIGDDLVFTNFSNKSMDFIILKVSRFNASLNKTITTVDENLRSTYSSIFFKRRYNDIFEDKTIYLEDVVIIETNYRKIIKNVFIPYNSSTLFFTYKCNELDKQICDALITEAIQHVSLLTSK